MSGQSVVSLTQAIPLLLPAISRGLTTILLLHLLQGSAQSVNLCAILGVEAIEIAAATAPPSEPFQLIIAKSGSHGWRQSAARLGIQGSHDIVQATQARLRADARFRTGPPIKVRLAIETGSIASGQLRKIYYQRSTNCNKLAHGDLLSLTRTLQQPEFFSIGPPGADTHSRLNITKLNWHILRAILGCVKALRNRHASIPPGRQPACSNSYVG